MEPKDVERWLASEEGGDEHGAESAFTRLFGAVPRIEPLPGFTERASTAAWRSRLRRRMIARASRAAAVLAVVLGGGAASWLLLRYAWPWLLTSGAAMVSGSLVGIVAGAVAGLEWWAAGARVAATMGETLSHPETAGALLATEVVGAIALYALHQLTRTTRTNGTQ
jgi:hypothetical protein